MKDYSEALPSTQVRRVTTRYDRLRSQHPGDRPHVTVALTAQALRISRDTVYRALAVRDAERRTC